MEVETTQHLVISGDLPRLEYVLRKLEKDVTARRRSFFTCCQSSAKDDRSLSDERLEPLLGTDGAGNTPLHYAFRRKTSECAKLICRYVFRLVRNPTNICDILQQKNGDGHTLFHIAVASRSTECCELLFEMDKLYEVTRRDRRKRKLYGAWLKQAVLDMTTWANHRGQTAALLLALSKCPCAERTEEPPVQPVIQSCRQCRKESFDMVRLLYKQAPQIFPLRDLSSGKTPFMLAAASGNLSMVQALREVAQADIEAIDCDGRTALHLATTAGINEVVVYLLHAAGASASVHDGDGYTPMHYAAMFKRTGVLALLHAANPSLGFAVDFLGRTALHIAVLYGASDCARALISNGADVWATDHRGFDPFMYALDMDNVVLFTTLLGAGVNINGLSVAEETTTLGIALRRNNSMVARYLRVNGARTFEEVKLAAVKKIQRWYRLKQAARYPLPEDDNEEETKIHSVEGKYKKRVSPVQSRQHKYASRGVQRRRSVADLVDIFERMRFA